MTKAEMIEAIKAAKGDSAMDAENRRIRRHRGKQLADLSEAALKDICKYARISLESPELQAWNALLGKFQTAYDYAMQIRRVNEETGEASLSELMTVGDAYDYHVSDEDAKLERESWQAVQQAAQDCKAHPLYGHPMYSKWHGLISDCAAGTHRYMV